MTGEVERNRGFRRAAAAVTLAVVMAASMASTALAHGEHVHSDPEEGERLNKKPQHIALELSEAPVESSKIAVFDGCGTNVTQATYVDGNTIHAVPKKSAGRGKWKVEYEVVSAEDGHRTEGSYGFRVKGRCVEESEVVEPDATAADADNSPGDDEEDEELDAGPASDTGDSFPVLPVLGLAAAALVGIAVLARRGV